MISKVIVPFVIASTLVLASCGGSSGSGSKDEGITYTGSKSPASVNATNADTLAIAAAGGANQAIAADSANNANPISPRGIPNQSNLALWLKRQLEFSLLSNNRIANQLIPICDMGTADLNQNGSGTQGSIIFSGCVVTGGNGEILTGTANFSATVNGSTITSLTISLVNFSVTILGETQTINMTISCGGNPLVCDLFSDYVGLDGRIYRVEITVVTNTAGTSFDVDATVFDPEHGFFTIDASINYNNCPGSVPETGAINLTGSAATTASVVFNDCDSFTVTHMGVSTVYFWANIL